MVNENIHLAEKKDAETTQSLSVGLKSFMDDDGEDEISHITNGSDASSKNQKDDVIHSSRDAMPNYVINLNPGDDPDNSMLEEEPENQAYVDENGNIIFTLLQKDNEIDSLEKFGQYLSAIL